MANYKYKNLIAVKLFIFGFFIKIVLVLASRKKYRNLCWIVLASGLKNN